MTTFLLTLVRHGTTDAKRRISKTVDCKGGTLSRRGYCQADLLGERLKCEHFTHIYCSDVSKAKETAVVIANHNRFCSKLTINEDPRLEELRLIKESQGNHSIKDINDTILDKLETLEDIRHRAEDFFLEICNIMRRENKRKTSAADSSPETSQNNANVLVVSHKSLLREMLRYFSSELGCSLPRRSGRKVNWHSSYTGVSVFRVTLARTDDLLDNMHVECLSLNDNSHLNRRTLSSDSDELDKSVESPS